jgi:hypothetical protein
LLLKQSLVVFFDQAVLPAAASAMSWPVAVVFSVLQNPTLRKALSVFSSIPHRARGDCQFQSLLPIR